MEVKTFKDIEKESETINKEIIIASVYFAAFCSTSLRGDNITTYAIVSTFDVTG